MDLTDEHTRVFFALWPNRQGREELVIWQNELRPLCGGRVMRPDTLHTTLVFLGEVAVARLEALVLAAREIEFHPFELTFETARYWGHNHIVYAAPDSVPPPLLELVTELERGLVKHKFHFERRPYKPHVTLLRNVLWSDADLPVLPVTRWECHEFVLLQSLRDERGGHYGVLARFAASALE